MSKFHHLCTLLSERRDFVSISGSKRITQFNAYGDSVCHQVMATVRLGARCRCVGDAKHRDTEFQSKCNESRDCAFRSSHTVDSVACPPAQICTFVVDAPGFNEHRRLCETSETVHVRPRRQRLPILFALNRKHPTSKFSHGFTLHRNHLALDLPRIGFTSHRNHLTSESPCIGITLLGSPSNEIIELLSSMLELRWKPHFLFRVLQAMLKLRSGAFN